MNTKPVKMVKRASFRTLTNVRKVAILVSSGDVEIYNVEDDGAEIFERYLPTGPARQADTLWITGAAAALDRAVSVWA